VKIRRYPKPHNAAVLYQELVAAFPELAPIDVGDTLPGVPGTVLRARFTLSSAADEVVLEVPDDTDDAALEAAVEAHANPAPPPPPAKANYGADAEDIDTRAAQAVTAIRAYLATTKPAANATAAEIREHVRVMDDELRILSKVVLALVKRAGY